MLNNHFLKFLLFGHWRETLYIPKNSIEYINFLFPVLQLFTERNSSYFVAWKFLCISFKMYLKKITCELYVKIPVFHSRFDHSIFNTNTNAYLNGSTNHTSPTVCVCFYFVGKQIIFHSLNQNLEAFCVHRRDVLGFDPPERRKQRREDSQPVQEHLLSLLWRNLD